MDNTQGDIVILTGAGISQESGLDTFRDKEGLWSKVNIEDVATPNAFQNDPKRVQEFYNDRRRPLTSGSIKPNNAHNALAKLENEWSSKKRGQVTIVTQNIDNLHEMAGSRNLIHMHGEILKARCQQCGCVSICNTDLGFGEACTECAEINVLRPHVVWFGETPLEMEKIYGLLKKCSLFISVGTSGNVYPAASFIQFVGANLDIFTLELNLEPSEGSMLFDQARYGVATDLIPLFVEELLTRGIPQKTPL